MRKTIFKKSLVLLLAFSMVFSVAGCGRKDVTPEKQKMSEADKDAIYTYETIEWDEETRNNMGGIQVSGDLMYTTVYEYNEETYESTSHLVIYDLLGKELSRILIPSGYNDNSSYGMNSFAVANVNEIYGVKYEYTNDTDETTGEWIWNEFYSLVKFDGQGNELWSESLGSSGSQQVKDGGEYYGVNSLVCDEAGNVWVFDTVSYTCYDKDGNKGISIEAVENASGNVWFTKEGNFIVGQWDEEWTTVSFLEVDTKSGKISSEPLVAPGSYYQYGYSTGLGSKWDMYATNTTGVWAFNWGDTEMTKIMDYILSDFDGSNIYNVKALDDTHFVASYYDNEWNYRVATFTKVPKEEVADKYLINLACYYIDTDVRKQVIEFNRSQEDVRITLTDYSVFNSEENEWQGGIEQLNADILAGKVPDILIAPTEFDMSMYVNKGLFTNLYALMEQDDTIKQDDYLKNILALGEYNGELYELIPRFNAVTMVVKKSDVGDKLSWNYDDVNALLAKKGENVRLFAVDSTKNGVMRYGVNLAFDQFYNNNTGECYFDSPEFIQYLELINQYPEELPNDLWEQENFWEQYEQQWRNGETIAKFEHVYGFRNYVENSQGYFGEPISYIGFPTKEGSGSSAYVDFTMAISEESAFKNEAWEFISYFIKDDYQDNISSGFPVKLSSLDKKAEKEMKQETWVDEETGEEIVEDSYFWIGNEEIILKMPTKEECQYVIDFLKTIDYRQRNNEDILAIMEEDTAAYFEGQKTAKQVADTIQSRVKIYVSEKR